MGRTGGERTSNGAKPPDTVDIIKHVSSPSHTIKHHLEKETLPTFDKFTHKLS